MLRRWSPAWLARLAAVAALAGAVGVLPFIPAAPGSAQSGADCLREVMVQTGIGPDGNPTYELRVIDVCENEGSDGTSGGAGGCEVPGRGPVPCNHPVYGWWSPSELCWVQLAEPQPEPGDEVWDGNDPSDGAIYQFACPQDANTESVFLRFLAEAPEGPSIEDLVQQAIRSLPLAPAEIGIAPDPGGIGLVGVPVWMWTEDTGATWGPVQVTVPGPGITVTAEGQAEQIEWDMGDGTVVVCESPGTPYDPSYGGEPSPDCGHVYTYPSLNQPDGRYQITATTSWQVEWWVNDGGSGVESGPGFLRESSTSVQIHELQVVTS